VVTDQLGTVVSRHDYTGFGKDIAETLGATTGGRTSAQGYGATDELRKQYTGYERDDESGFEYAQARYYNGDHGRFTSVDPLMASADIKNPQTFNRYSYVLNSPYKYVDPLGLISSSTGACGQWCQGNDGGAIGWTQSYDSGWRNGWEIAGAVQQQTDTGIADSTATANGDSYHHAAAAAGPATLVGGKLVILGKEFKGNVDPFNNLTIDVPLDQLTPAEQSALTGVDLPKDVEGIGFKVNVDLDLGNSKNVPIETQFAEKEVVARPGRLNDDGTVTQPILRMEKAPLDGSSRVRTGTSETSNVRVADDGRVTFSDPVGQNTIATFRGSFNYDPGASRRSSFYLTVITKRSDYRSPERSNFTVRLNLISK